MLLPGLVVVSGGMVTGVAWWLRRSGVIRDHYPPTFGLWVGVSLLALLVAVAGWPSTGRWRRGIAIAAVPLTLTSACLLMNDHYDYWPTIGDVLGRPLPDEVRSGAGTRLAAGRFSEGGTCAIELGIRHPEVYGAFVDLAGDWAPNLGSPAHTLRYLYGGNRAAMAAHDPARLVRPGRFRTQEIEGSFMAGASDADHVRVAGSLSAAARSAGITTTETILPGGHGGGRCGDWRARRRPVERGDVGGGLRLLLYEALSGFEDRRTRLGASAESVVPAQLSSIGPDHGDLSRAAAAATRTMLSGFRGSG